MIFKPLMRLRLKLDGGLCDSHLKRYKDPETGKYYVGLSRFDPALVSSVMNHYNGDNGVSEQ